MNIDDINILQILKSKGPLPYDELRTQCGFMTQKESGKFAYHLKKLVEQSFVSRDSESVCAITNLGKLESLPSGILFLPY